MPAKVCPVIHVANMLQATTNIERALEAKVDGVFLINHDIPASDLFLIGQGVRSAFPDIWIGVNFLSVSDFYRALWAPQIANALWMDKVPYHRLDITIPVFGGVAFKYQHSPLTLEEELHEALPKIDVVVTSGEATGEAADPQKVKTLKELAPLTPLGLASGLTPDNVQSYLPWTDWLLVATGVSTDFNNLCPDKLRDFVQAVRG